MIQTTPESICKQFATPPAPGTREFWLAERMGLLTASDVPAALGISPWKSPLELWAEKTGTIEAEDIGAKDAVKWGLRLEQPVAMGYSEDTGRTVKMSPPYTLLRHPSISFLGATPDALQVAPEYKDLGCLQVKTTSAYKKSDWAEEPPIYYQVQLQTELFVTGMPWGTLAALIGGQQLVWFDMTRNDRFLDAMLPKLEAFWELVKSKTPPPVGGSEADSRILAKLWPEHDGELLFSDDSGLTQAASDREGAIAKMNELKSLREAAENKLVYAIGPAMGIRLADGRVFTHKQQTRKEHVVKESTFRVLRETKPKKR